MEVAMLVGLAALGYALSTQPKREVTYPRKEDPIETFINPKQTEQATEQVTHTQSQTGHNNMVPFFGGSMTQSMYSGATDGVLDLYTGKGKHSFHHKEEAPAFFTPEAGRGRPWKAPVETDWEQSRQVTSMSMKNVFPIEQVQVGPGVNDGYTNLPKGGYQQDDMRDYAMPKTTDERRVANKPKVSYQADPVPGARKVKERADIAPVKKNRPDRFQVLIEEDGSMNHLNTTKGQSSHVAIYPHQLLKEQTRESTSHDRLNGVKLRGGGLSYIRAFTEPFQDFMKLTVEGRPRPAGPVAGMTLHAGPQSYNVQTHRDESLLADAARETPAYMVFGGMPPDIDLQGSQRYVEPLQQDINVARNDADLLKAFHDNPYTKSLQSSA